MRLDGKLAVITGGTQGLGAATAREFVGQGAAGLVICGRNADKGSAVAADLEPCPTVFVPADLTSVADCRAVIAAAREQFGRVDVLVNAGASTARGTILDTTPEAFDAMIATNLRGPFFLMQEALQLMIDTGTRGAIVNVGSISERAGQSFLAAYVASKAGLSSLTRNAAWAMLRHQIRINGLNIGWMESDQERALHAAQGHGPDWFAARAAELPFKRLIQPNEVARAIAFLASDASGLMTGEVMNYDQTIWGAQESAPSAPYL